MESTNSQVIEYDPDNLLNEIKRKLRLKNDAALARILDVAPPIVSKIRKRRLAVGGIILIRMHEVTQLSIKDLRSLMGDNRDKFKIIPLEELRGDQ